jgi:hypothetical protein
MRVTVIFTDEEYGKVKERAGLIPLSRWIKSRVIEESSGKEEGGASDRVPDVRGDVEVRAPRRRKPSADELDLPVVGEGPKRDVEGPKCKHGVAKGWRCWQCGGKAIIGGE